MTSWSAPGLGCGLLPGWSGFLAAPAPAFTMPALAPGRAPVGLGADTSLAASNDEGPEGRDAGDDAAPEGLDARAVAGPEGLDAEDAAAPEGLAGLPCLLLAPPWGMFSCFFIWKDRGQRFRSGI